MEKLIRAEKRAKRKEEKLSNPKKHKGFDGLIVTVGLILIVILLIFAVKTVILPKLNSSIENAGNSIDQINDWDNGPTQAGP